MKKYKLTRREVAILLRAQPVVQLDYFTGEFIAVYESLEQLASDNDAPLSSVTGAHTRDECIFCRVRKYELCFCDLDRYIQFCKTYRNFDMNQLID